MCATTYFCNQFNSSCLPCSMYPERSFLYDMLPTIDCVGKAVKPRRESEEGKEKLYSGFCNAF